MSRRRARRTQRTPSGRDPAGARREDAPGRRILRDILVLAVLFGITVGIAELAGAANLGVAFGIGQIAFAIGLVVLLTRA